MLSQAQISGYMVQGGLLVLDEVMMPDEKETTHIVGPMRDMKRSLHEAWLVNSLENVPESVTSLFDLVVHIPTMPLADRIVMARRLMGDELCEKVAQAATLPGEIANMAHWAKRVGVNNWNALSGCLLGVQRARMAQRKDAGQLPVQLYPPGTSKHGFEAVIGEDRNVARAKELSEALKRPDAYKKMGITPPKGLLLLGAPGTGKTHLARAMAREAGVNLLLADAAALAETPDAIHAVFNEARKQAPCILFIDEIDAIAAATEKRAPDPKRQSILNRLLTELDGFEALDGVLVIGATHRSDLLDDAVTRAGRLGHSIMFKLPEREQREALWKHYTRNMPVATEIDWHRVGRSSTGMSPADIAQGANEAGLRAVRDGCDQIQLRHLLSAIEEMLWGEYSDHMPIAQSERWRTSVHESGHAMLGWHHRIEIERACVRPQGQALGFVRWIPEEGRHSQRQGDLVAQLNMLFGGLAAETVILGSHGTGSSSDLMKVRMTVSAAIRGEGMHTQFPAGVYHIPGEPSPSLARSQQAEKVEDELIAGAHAQTLAWLTAHKEVLHKLAELLMEKRELDGNEIQVFLDKALGEGARAPQEQAHLTLAQAARFPKVDV
jgi:cell division protease FtsH